MGAGASAKGQDGEENDNCAGAATRGDDAAHAEGPADAGFGEHCRLRQIVRDIINDMVKDGIVKDKDSFLWFGLDYGQFVVDGRPMADSLRVKYAAKYVKADGNGYYYGSVSVHGRGYFFDKKEIFGDDKQ